MAEFDHTALLELFTDLITIDAPSGAEKPVADFIRQRLAGLPVSITEDDAGEKVDSNSGNLICEIGNGGEIVLLAHMDTASPTAGLKPQVLEDRITSAGDTILGADDRAGVAVLITALELASQAPEQYRDFTVVFTVREEGGVEGSKCLSLSPNIKLGYAFDSSVRPGHFIAATYGAQRFTVKVQGRAAHSGINPEHGIHAIHVAARAMSRIPMGRVKEDLLVNIGTVVGGSAVNIVPAEAEARGEVRGIDPGQVEAQIAAMKKEFQTAADAEGAEVDFQARWDFEAYHYGPGDDVYQRIEAAIQGAGLEPIASTTAGGSDANSLNSMGITAMNVGIGSQKCHSNEEFILIEDLLAAQRIALALLIEQSS
jgi:tripeptide aminopeptidase